MNAVPIEVRPAAPTEHDAVAALVYELLVELFPAYCETLKRNELARAARDLLASGRDLWAFLAIAPSGEAVGVLTLNECAAIYAGGRFGEICELYVAPTWRSAKVGAMLIDTAAAFGRDRGWPMLEVGAPDVPRWQRTVDFYLGYGFSEVGPRLELKLVS